MLDSLNETTRFVTILKCCQFLTVYFILFIIIIIIFLVCEENLRFLSY